jgi:streptogramin lyase
MTLRFITGAAAAAILFTGCGKTYPVNYALPTPAPLKPSVTGSYTITTAASQPEGLVSGPDDSIWFAEEDGNNIGALDTAAKITEFPLPNAGSEPYGVTSGPDGNVWFTEYAAIANKIGRYDPSTGNFAEFAIPTADAEATSIVLGSDGALWFTEYGTARIGRITLTGTVTDYAVGGSEPLSAAEGSDGAVWFTEYGSNQIGRISTTEQVTLYNVPTAASQPYNIVPGSDGALWFTEHATGKLGRITTNSGTFSEVTLTGCATPGPLRQGVDGNFYIFCLGASPLILQYNPTTTKSKSFPLKSGSVPQLAIVGFDNRIYFTDSGLNEIEQFTYQ